MKFYTSVHCLKDKILLRGFENGKRVMYRIPYKPTLYVNSKTGNTKFRTITGKPVDPIQFESIPEARDFVNRYKDVSGFDIYGLTNYVYAFINDYYPGQVDYDASLIDISKIDIECEADQGFPDIQLALNAITAITLEHRDIYYVFGAQPYKVKANNVKYFETKNEYELLLKFLDVYKTIYPDIITGWNIEIFDIPYLINRITRVLGLDYARQLSPWSLLEEREVYIAGKPIQMYNPVGVAVIDYLPAYKKFKFEQQESYRLDHIMQVELGEGKLDYSQYDSLIDLYRKNFDLFIDYNIRDVEGIQKLDNKLGFINQILALAYDGKVLYNDTFTTVRMWDTIIHNHLLSENTVVPQSRGGEKTEQIDGAYVKDPQVGEHKWVVSFDLTSLYPHLIMQYNISPETLRGRIPDHFSVDQVVNGALTKYNDFLIDKNYCVSATGYLFDRDFQGFLPQLMERVFNDRKQAKVKMLQAEQELEYLTDPDERKAKEAEIAKYHNFQMAKKIQLNSAYGALSNQYFRYYDDRLAESITQSGQLSTRWIEAKLNGLLNRMLKTDDVDYVIACDTDSVYLNLGPVVDTLIPAGKTNEEIVTILDKFCEERIQPFLNKSYTELAEYVNAYQQKMFMKREAIANKGIWTGKKHYILNVYNSEGVAYAEPKLKMKGIEAVKSSTPSICRDAIKKGLKIIMNDTEDELIAFVDQFRETYYSLPFEDVAFPRSCKNLEKYSDRLTIYGKKTPPHVRGALLYNHMLKEAKLDNRYRVVQEGDKIKFAYLKLPNPLRENVVSCPGQLPRQLGLDPFIDYEMMFDKTFKDPLEAITNVIGWNLEHKATLDSFWS